MIEKKYLDEFAYFKDRVYLDCSSLGMQPECTIQMGREYQEDWAYHLGKLSRGDHPEQRALLRKRIGEMIHADPEDIVLTQNTSQGNNMIPYGYPFQPGDEVIFGNGDFGTLYLPWAGKQRDGVKLVIVENQKGIVDVEDIIRHMTERTKVAAISWVQSSSGYRADLARLGRVCRERGILLLVDGVQGVGRLPVDVQEMNIDVFSASSFKGLLGVMGAGFCYCRREVMDLLTPPFCCDNIDWEHYVWEENFTSLGIPEYAKGALRMETGTVNNYGYILMSESIRLLSEIGFDRIAAQIREVEAYYRDRLKESGLAVEFLGSDAPEHWSGSVSFLYDNAYREALIEALEKAEIYVAVRKFLRVSIHYYNTKQDIDRLMEVLVRVLPKA